MLVIRVAQLQQFQKPMFELFIDQCTEYVRQFHSGRASKCANESELRNFTADCLHHGKELGFKDRGDFRKLLEWECEFGPRFYELPQWSWLKDILETGLTPATRIFRIENRLNLLRARGAL